MSHDTPLISAQSRGAWHELEARLRPYLARRVPSPSDVDDVVQEVFVRIHRGFGELRDVESFGGWVYRIAERAAIDHQRARARHPFAAESAGDVPAPEEHASADEVLQAALTECIALFIARLPSRYREAITRTELDGMTQREAAEQLGLSISGMKSRIQRGREQIRLMFEQCCEVDVDARGHVVECTPRALDRIPLDCREAATAWAAHRRCGG